MSDELPLLPYAGTSGWSGSDASRERAETEDRDGTTTRRQSQVIFLLAGEGALGATWKEVADRLGWHHGQASGALSVLHKEGKVDRLTTRRNRCSVYVLPQFRLGRDAAPHGRRRTPPEREILLDLIAELRDGDYYVWTYPECVHPAVAILSDLIKELRAQHYADQCECGCEQWYECEPCSHISLCPTQEAAVRAEARLREMQGE